MKHKTGMALLTVLLLLVLLPGTAFGHATLLKAIPEESSQLAGPPAQVALAFNERLEDELYYIKVLDELGRSVTSNKAHLTQDHHGLMLDLPKLGNSTYTVSYHVISADGHPVDGSYVFTVGFAEAAPPAAAGHQHHHELSANVSAPELFVFASRIFYYLAMLGLTGWLFWHWQLIQGDAAREAISRRWLRELQRAFLVSLVLLVFFHYRDLLGDTGTSEIFALFTGTAIGRSWLVSFVLTVLGFGLLGRAKWLDYIWAAALLYTKSWNGHAAAYNPRWLLVLLDTVHLAAAAVWAGGLFMLLVYWRHKEWVGASLRRFSGAALFSIIALAVSGSISTLLFLPHLWYLLYTQWGQLLLIKIGLVILVIVVAAVIRRRLRKQDTGLALPPENADRAAPEAAAPEAAQTGVKKHGSGANPWVRVDFTLMLAIVFVVGIFTYVSPIPANEPLNWHEMGVKQHLTVKISPNAPGENTFIVKVWLPEQAGKPKEVHLLLTSTDHKSLGPIEVPLSPYNDPENEVSFGFTRYSYRSTGPYLPFAGGWKVEVRVLDASDTETDHQTAIRIF